MKNSIYSLFLLVLSLIWSGFVVTKLWKWFVVPTFDVKELSIPIAIGISLFLFFTTKADLSELPTKHDDKTTKEKLMQATINVIFKPTFILLFGWIVSLFI